MVALELLSPQTLLVKLNGKPDHLQLHRCQLLLRLGELHSQALALVDLVRQGLAQGVVVVLQLLPSHPLLLELVSKPGHLLLVVYSELGQIPLRRGQLHLCLGELHAGDLVAHLPFLLRQVLEEGIILALEQLPLQLLFVKSVVELDHVTHRHGQLLLCLGELRVQALQLGPLRSLLGEGLPQGRELRGGGRQLGCRISQLSLPGPALLELPPGLSQALLQNLRLLLHLRELLVRSGGGRGHVPQVLHQLREGFVPAGAAVEEVVALARGAVHHAEVLSALQIPALVQPLHGGVH
mmetsp:Transcript_108470/g.263646  ORF Transcript_108470/g.263646 Transcript_108470/m.263646 type:complete len:295 (-) Transcript_108470:90-974(-)